MTRHGLGIRVVLLVVCLLLAILGVARAIKPVWVEDVIIADGVKQGWVLIEFGNPSCPPAKESFLRRVIDVPASGYACTSTAVDKSVLLSRYYRRNLDRSKTRLTIDHWIQGRMLSDGTSATVLPGGAITKACRIQAETFWYGAPHSGRGDPEAVIRAHHPECP